MNVDFGRERVFLTGTPCFKVVGQHSGYKGAPSLKDTLKPNTNPSLFELADIHNGIESEFGDIGIWMGRKNPIDFFTKYNPYGGAFSQTHCTEPCRYISNECWYCKFI